MKNMSYVVAALVMALGAEILADSAVNSFAMATGDGVQNAGDAGFVVVNAQGPVPVTLAARPGWKFSEGKVKEVIYRPPQVLKLPIFGLDGEEREELIISNAQQHVHQTTNYNDHIACGVLKATAREHVLGLYPESEAGVELFVPGSYEVISDHVHGVVMEKLPCPIAGCAWGVGEDRIVKTEAHAKPLPVKVEYRFDNALADQPEPRLYPKGSHPYVYSVSHTNECDQCCCGALDSGVADIYQAEMETDPWIGLDRTDEGRETNIVKVATAAVPDFNGTIKYAWTPSVHCEAEDGRKTDTFSYQPKDHDTPSATYCGETHACRVSIADGHNCSDSALVTNRFTIVKLDVQIGKDENETTEETEGYCLYEIPDRDGAWTEEATNALVQVSITCEPHDAKMLSERVTVEVRDELLHECRMVNGRKEYTRAKASYTVRELMKTKFVLHGHSRSEKYLGDAIKVTHPTSGAVDLAKFTIFGRPWLVPDYDRKHGIDDEDLAKAKQGKIFRFWINDDDDWGDTCSAEDYTEDMTRSGNDCRESRVSGRRDLVDYTPVMLDISEVFPEGTPLELMSIAWKLQSPCLNVVWSLNSGKESRRFQTEDLPNCGRNCNCIAYKAPVDMLSTEQELPLPEVVAQRLASDAKPVFYVEGSKAGEGLSMFGQTRDGKTLTKGFLDIRITGIDKMYRWVSIRPDEETTKEQAMEAPENWPDEDTDYRNYVFVHGFNVNVEEARASGEDLFKRLWQSGLDSMVSVVAWDGDFGQVDIPIDWHGTMTLEYHECVRRAFLRADKLKQVCADWLPGAKVIVAHSLGNMLASSVIVDCRLEYQRYWMLDAAVAIEAYSATAKDQPTMVGSGWDKAPEEYRASRWWKLHKNEKDFRRLLRWDGRFEGLANAVNCYSTTEDVVGNYDPENGHYDTSVWYVQELIKGRLVLHLTDIAFSGRIRSQGGWGFNNWYLMDPRYSLFGRFLSSIKKITAEQAIQHPLFTTFCLEEDDEQKMYSTNLYVIAEKEKRDGLRAFLLGSAIPAESFAAGANAMNINGIEDLDMMSMASNTQVWPGSRKQPIVVGYKENGRTGERKPIYEGYKRFWYHSDFKQVAYFFNYQLFDEFIDRE